MKSQLLIILVFFAFPSFGKEKIKTFSSNPVVLKQVANCNPPTSDADLDINNVRTTILAGSDMWSDLANAKYEIPIGSGKHSIYAGALWIGGIDAGGQIRVAAQTYRQTGVDWWAGAMDTTTVNITSAQCNYYDRHWKLTRQQVLDFVNNGTTTTNIIQWPGNGNMATNEGTYLAPYMDVNNDGVYNYVDGDYPGYNLGTTYPYYPGTLIENYNNFLFGDQTIWWVINDVGNIHTETGSNPLGLEVRCQAFAFQSNSTAINNSTFYKYQMINRSSSTYSNMYFGQWIDPDLGNYVDDYVGCDVIRGLGYCYNGDFDDETAAGYGLNPPAIGVDFLQGPGADPLDNVDNDHDGCVDCTFIDSAGTTITVPDYILPEGNNMSKFVYYNNINNSPVGNPNGFTDFYNYLRGIWLDNQPITYGADGRNAFNPVCDYMFPGTSDPLFSINWTETTAGNIPDDRRFLQSGGPFTMAPGAVNYVSTSVVWARATSGGPNASVTLLKQHDDQVQDFYSNGYRLSGVGLDEFQFAASISVYPNPTSDFVIFQTSETVKDYVITIFNTSGNLVFRQKVTGNNFRLNTENFSKGAYFYNLDAGNNHVVSGKLIVY